MGYLTGASTRVVNVGLESFSEAVRAQEISAVDVAWRPPAGGDPELVRLLVASGPVRERIAAANEEAFRRMVSARPAWVGIRRAADVIPGMDGRIIIHSGPARPYEIMCGPHQRAAAWAAVWEGWASNPEAAARALAAGEIRLEPTNLHSAVCPMAGVISPSMAVNVVRDESLGLTTCGLINEGREHTIWLGNPGTPTFDRLNWFRDELGPALTAALERLHGLDLFSVYAQALQMGDELHARFQALTAILIRSLAAPMLEAGISGPAAARVIRFLEGNPLFALPITMAGCRVATDAAHGIPYSTVVTGMSRNARDFGLRVSGLGDRWLTRPLPAWENVLYYTGYSDRDNAGDIGDSSIIECAGIGYMAIAAAPTMAAFAGGTVDDEARAAEEMATICVGAHPTFTVPALGFAGTPTGIDVRLVVETGIVPRIDTGAVHETSPVVGQIGAGAAPGPIELFQDSLRALGEKWAAEGGAA